jgi:hypothetical protein
MTQAHHILNRFSDAYVAAMLDGSSRESVLATYQLTYPELKNELHTEAERLQVLYGYLSTTEHPADAEIASAYKTFAAVSPEIRTIKEKGFFAKLGAVLISPSPVYRYAAIAAVFVIGLMMWRPWSVTSPTNPSIAPTISDQNQVSSTPESHSQTPSVSPQSNPIISPTPEATPSFRGIDDNDEAQKPTTPASPEDANRLKQLAASKSELATAQGLSLKAMSKGTISLQWDPVPGALSYIIEIKGANDRAFRPVTEVAHPNARIGMLTSGDTVSIRIIAASGERKGQPSDAKSIVVP